MNSNIPFDSVSGFVKIWKNYAKKIIKNKPDERFLYAHPSDFDALSKMKSGEEYIDVRTYDEYLRNDAFLGVHFSGEILNKNKKEIILDQAIHIGLPLGPFAGNLETAKFVLLLMNPGASPSDYYKSSIFNYCVNEDVFSHILKPCYMRPEMSWHAGYTYGIKRWRRVLDELFVMTKSKEKSLQILRAGVAILQYSPYPSRNGNWKILNKLPTSQYAKAVAQMLIDEGRVVVCGRGVEQWKIEKGLFEDYSLKNPRNPQFENPRKVAELLIGSSGFY